VNPDEPLILVGASVRAAAFSALRAGLSPWCVDLYADRDLAARCPARRVAPSRYPGGIAALLREAPPGPWMYAGAFENHRLFVRRLRREHPRRSLWGNDAAVLAAVRDPRRVHALLTAAGLPCPAVRPPSAKTLPPGRWLVKRTSSAAGVGVGPVVTRPPAGPRGRGAYLQQFVEGESHGAVYAALPGRTHLLGVSRQLLGGRGKSEFAYAGSVGPVYPGRGATRTLQRVGAVLAAGAGLRGLFGVDFVLADGVPWPVEVNPRYSGSVEVLEYATGLRALEWHRRAFDPGPPPAPPRPARDVVGKSIYRASRAFTFPEDGPWADDLKPDAPVDGMPGFADLPRPGESFAAGQPVLTCFARAADVAACVAALQSVRRHLDGLFRRG